MYFIYILTLCFGEFSVAGDDLGVFQGLSIQKYENGYSVMSRAESTLVLLDAHGLIKSRYNKIGEGPNELSNPSYLGYYQKSHVVLTQGQYLVWFNEKLEPQKEKYTKLTSLISSNIPIYGLHSPKGWYLVNSGLAMSDHLVNHVQLTTHGFKIVAGTFAQPYTSSKVKHDSTFLQKVTSNFRIDVHAGKAFKSVLGVPIGKDDYNVEIYNELNQDRDPEMILSAPLDDQLLASENPPIKAYIENGFAFPDGFIVLWNGRAKIMDKELTTYLDFFSIKGGFLQRKKLKVPLFPCINSAEAFCFEELSGKDVLKRVSSMKQIAALAGP